MEVKVFSFNKTEKSPSIIEKAINDFLEGKAFKFCSQSESSTKGKFYLSLFYENNKSNIKARVFKNTKPQILQDEVNEFLKEGHTMRWSCQSSSTSNVFLVVFYESRKANGDKKEANENKG